MGPQLAVIVSKCPRLKNVYKSNKETIEGTIERNNRRSSVYTLHKTVCVMCERVRHRLWGTCNNRTMVPHKEIQWNNGTPQGKFYSLATFGHKREDNQVPHKSAYHVIRLTK